VGRAEMDDQFDAIYLERDRLVYQMWSIPAETNLSRAAKVRALLKFVVLERKEDPADMDPADMNWDDQMALRLLLEFAGQQRTALDASTADPHKRPDDARRGLAYLESLRSQVA
jgi:hypothetical protein